MTWEPAGAEAPAILDLPPKIHDEQDFKFPVGLYAGATSAEASASAPLETEEAS
jgi:hypothetical protein